MVNYYFYFFVELVYIQHVRTQLTSKQEMTDYNLFTTDGGSFVTLGGDGVLDNLDKNVKSLMESHYQLAFAALIILLLLVVWMWLKWAPKEQFNPGQTLRVQQRDDTGATNVIQSNGVGVVATQQAVVAPKPGTEAYDILNSASFNCAGRVPVGTDAWAYMNGVANEKDANGSTQAEFFSNGNLNNTPINDNKLSAIMGGQ